MLQNDDDDYSIDNEYEWLDKLFPNIQFSVSSGLYYELDDIISKEPTIILKQSYGCYCYSAAPRTTDYISITNKGNGITWRDIILHLQEIQYDPVCNHQFLEGIDKITEVEYGLFFGS